MKGWKDEKIVLVSSPFFQSNPIENIINWQIKCDASKDFTIALFGCQIDGSKLIDN